MSDVWNALYKSLDILSGSGMHYMLSAIPQAVGCEIAY